MQNQELVRKEVLTYLARLPHLLQENGPDCAGQIAVQLGNCLLWIHEYLEPGGAHTETPLHETADSIYALGKQLRQVGLYWWEKKNHAKTDRVAALEAEVSLLRNWFTRMDETLTREITKQM